MQFPVVNDKLAAQIRQSEIDFLASRIESIAERDGNPEGVEIRSFGKATAFYIRTMPWSLFNSVKGLTAAEEDQIGEWTRFYCERGRDFQVDVDPHHCSPGLLAALRANGLGQTGFHSVLYGLPLPERPTPPSNIEIIEIREQSHFDAYAEIHCLGSGMPLTAKPHFINNNIGLLNRSGWKLFLALLDNVPAGVAAMHIGGTVASCALAATAPDFRNRGIQTALLRQRLYTAHEAGCRLVAAQAAFGSVSQNNMERTGFRIAWTRSIWSLI
ncbi:GNAT family N-acetyltransferase [Paenibacillus typhae]|uniref:GNAT family N-acetyltransferase n=1 Tax=Paenibacillus typhae TaxID=1174501 RepID=UPI001C8E1971|nr:GNAT family N-acetyltransferase [Paenibacillus typhae]MBY0011897.1 GNAT family N-acetyltransferase [Paenibacillus typhae]